MGFQNTDLSFPLNFDNITDFNEAIEKAYDKYLNSFMRREVRAMYQHKSIFVDCINWYLGHPQKFWHVIGLGDSETAHLNILPCINDRSSLHCNINCINHHHSTIEHNITKHNCLYRASRIGWINEVIQLANVGDDFIEEWDKEYINTSSSKHSLRRYIRYLRNPIDYIVILEYDKKGFRFITAFPVFYQNKKRDYTNDYHKYLFTIK